MLLLLQVCVSCGAYGKKWLRQIAGMCAHSGMCPRTGLHAARNVCDPASCQVDWYCSVSHDQT
jgi:hypothetical protein